MQEQILAGKKYAYQYDEAEKSIKILPISGSYLFQIGSFDGKTLNSASIELVYTVTAEKESADKLLTKIQTEGDGIYSNDDNVDYKFVLDRTALSEIRKYNKEQGNYRNYGKNFSIINGVSVYSSDLIRKGLLSDIKYSPIKGTLGCNNEKFGVCDNDLKIGG